MTASQGGGNAASSASSGRPERRPVIYHGTPMTPRAALLDVLPGRAGCVSFYRPDDVEAVEAVCPRIMFRQWSLQLLDGGHEARRGVGRQAPRLGAVLSLAGASAEAGPLGSHPRHAGRAEPAQRWPAFGLAVRPVMGCPALAYGRPADAAGRPLRALRHGGAGMDRRPEEGAGGLRPLPAAHGRSVRSVRQPLARHAHDARDRGGQRLPVRGSRCDQPSAERAPL